MPRYGHSRDLYRLVSAVSVAEEDDRPFLRGVVALEFGEDLLVETIEGREFVLVEGGRVRCTEKGRRFLLGVRAS